MKKSPVELLLKYGVPLIISGGLCWLLFRDLDLRRMWQLIVTECNYWWILASLIFSILSHIVRAMRWQIQLSALGVRAPLFYVVLSIFGTYAVNLVFPRLGEVWRTGYIAKRQDAPFATVFGSMLSDRLADTLTVLLILITTLFVAGEALDSYLLQNGTLYDTLRTAATSPIVWGIAAAGIAAVFWIFTTKSSNKAIRKLQQAVRELWQGFAVVLTMPGRGRWVVLVIATWACYFVQFYMCFYSFSFTTELLDNYGIMPALVGFVFASVAMGVPSNGGIGPWQWSVIIALGIYGLDSERANAFANLVLGSSTLLTIVLGFFTFAVIAISRHKTKIITQKKSESING